MKTKEAEEYIIFVIENEEIEKTTYYEHVIASIDETTSPRGVAPRLHLRQDGCFIYGENDSNFDPEDNVEVWTWGVGGNHPKYVDSFNTVEEAEDYIFEMTEKYDFEPDDQRDTRYFDTYEEAFEQLVEDYSYKYNVDLDVAKSIIHHEEVAQKIRDARKNAEIETKRKEKEKIDAQTTKTSAEYADMINSGEGETYQQTCKRLSEAIGFRINSQVFHHAVKIARKKLTS